MASIQEEQISEVGYGGNVGTIAVNETAEESFSPRLRSNMGANHWRPSIAES